MRSEQPAHPAQPAQPAATAAAEAQLLALLPHLPVGRVFRTSDGGESWTRADVGALLADRVALGPPA
jgi:hypothetical protein